jgi:hypothetical protein
VLPPQERSVVRPEPKVRQRTSARCHSEKVLQFRDATCAAATEKDGHALDNAALSFKLRRENARTEVLLYKNIEKQETTKVWHSAGRAADGYCQTR